MLTWSLQVSVYVWTAYVPIYHLHVLQQSKQSGSNNCTIHLLWLIRLIIISNGVTLYDSAHMVNFFLIFPKEPKLLCCKVAML